ncbi:hybrid sensor histidine kinase/response regulator [Halorientalis sp.]|uniref:hybrid sensor histidine kinase/response regulator n=1 Tax=Halorientalis sp. TaxID=1931229 RepID=UPI002615E6FE|nr:response regulator [Halorientalis sp.]
MTDDTPTGLSPGPLADATITSDENDGQVSILHVDDDPDMLSLSKTMLERRDIDVTTRTSAEEGLELLREADVGCIVSDYEMPRTDGLEFLEAVRKEYPDLPFILFTGKGGEEIASKAISAGVTDYLQKEPDEGQYTVLANRIVNLVEQYRVKKAVEQTQKRFSRLIEHSTDVISVVSPDARFEYLSPSAEHILGYEPSEMVGEYIFDYAHPEDRDEAMEKFFETVKHPDKQPTVEFRFKHPDGSWPVLESRGRNLLDDPDVQGFVVNSREITELREHEQKLKRQNDQLEGIRSAVSHDLKNPLNVARTTLDLVVEDFDDPDRRDDLPDHFDRLGRALDRMNAIISDMLTMAQQGQRVVDLEPIELSTVARAAWEMAGDDHATLELDDAPTVQADESRLQQLLENLFRNAVEHSATSDRSQAQADSTQHATTDVTVSLGTTTVVDGDDTQVVGLYVEDDGPGIPEDKQEKVFESGYSTAERGSGFGLAIVEQIARAHGWAVDIADPTGAQANADSPDTGTRVLISGVRVE